eukprot:c21616_g2_i1.p1 GENE.c21616_g2_i1~~c21616_g2_i1.p1  ORF type:complete len:257 (+),score=29.17 c21616_g2_i1:125-895(+)
MPRKKASILEAIKGVANLKGSLNEKKIFLERQEQLKTILKEFESRNEAKLITDKGLAGYEGSLLGKDITITLRTTCLTPKIDKINKWGLSQKFADFFAIKEFLRMNSEKTGADVKALVMALQGLQDKPDLHNFHTKLKEIEKDLYSHHVSFAHTNAQTATNLEVCQEDFTKKGYELINHFTNNEFHQDVHNTKQSIVHFEKEYPKYQQNMQKAFEELKTSKPAVTDENKAAAYRILLAVLGEGEKRYFRVKNEISS